MSCVPVPTMSWQNDASSGFQPCEAESPLPAMLLKYWRLASTSEIRTVGTPISCAARRVKASRRSSAGVSRSPELWRAASLTGLVNALSLAKTGLRRREVEHYLTTNTRLWTRFQRAFTARITASNAVFSRRESDRTKAVVQHVQKG